MITKIIQILDEKKGKKCRASNSQHVPKAFGILTQFVAKIYLNNLLFVVTLYLEQNKNDLNLLFACKDRTELTVDSFQIQQ